MHIYWKHNTGSMFKLNLCTGTTSEFSCVIKERLFGGYDVTVLGDINTLLSKRCDTIEEGKEEAYKAVRKAMLIQMIAFFNTVDKILQHSDTASLDRYIDNSNIGRMIHTLEHIQYRR